MPDSVVERLNAALEGRYRIQEELGAGGMATVYLAQDVKHKRQVAVKVLKPELAAVVGAERFLAEIRTTANLQHPHILPLFDSGEADSFLFYVMPYVEGESLRDRLQRERQLPMDQAVEIAKNVASALQYAHEQGVVHRDIKPANILLSRGEPLVADFGIALALSEAGGGRITETGLSLGTPHYMSPEQAAGERSLDPRSDVYALGCVLFEMLAGEPPHAGPTAQSVLAKILTDDVRRVTELRRSVPANVEAAVAGALEKLPADRISSAGEFSRALEDPAFRHGSGADREAGASPAGPWKVAALTLAATTLGLVAWLGVGARSTRLPRPVFRVAVELPETQGLLTPQLGSSLVLSPDGTRLVYAGASPNAPWQFWLRRADALEATPLPDTEASFTPVFSPDGDEIAFMGPTGQLEILDLNRGSTRTLADSAASVLDWSRDGWIYYHHGMILGNVWRIPADGSGEAQPLPLVSGNQSPTQIWGTGDALPGGRGMVITRFPQGSAGAGTGSIVAVDFESETFTQLVQGTHPTYLETGHLLWGDREGTLMVAPFDAADMELTGPATPVAEGVLLDFNAVMHYAVSRDGSLIYREGGSAGGTGGLVWVDRDGGDTQASELAVGLTVGLWEGLGLSPDGSAVALAVADGVTTHVWAQPLDRPSPPRRVTFGGTFNVRPEWTPDGEFLTFISNLGGQGAPTQLWRTAADGTGAPEPLVVAEREVEEGFVSPNGEWVVYRLGGTTTNRDIYARRLAGQDTMPVPLAATDANERAMDLSPDSRWLAYVSDETGRDEVFVRPFPEVARGKWQISSGGGNSPLWANDGSELFFVGASNEVMAASYAATGSSFTVSSVQPLFSAAGLILGGNHTAFEIAPDDQRFLVISVGGQQGRLVWIRNWIQEVERLTGQAGP